MLSRRTLLLGGAALLAGAGIYAARSAREARASRRAAERRLRGCFTEPRRVRALGQRYLKEHPEEADRERLVSLLVGELGELDAAATDEQLRERVAERVREDFARERTVPLAGWVVARTEARLAALIALPPQAAR